MNYIARILENNDVKLYTSDYFELYPGLVVDWVVVEITEEQYNLISTYKMPKYEDEVFFDSYVEVVEVPSKLHRMKFIIQVNRTTGIKYEDIVLFINNIPNESLNADSKYEILTRLRSAEDFYRTNSDLLLIAVMMGITQEQLDEIFINGNLIE